MIYATPYMSVKLSACIIPIIRTMSSIQIPLSTNEWLVLDQLSARAGLMPVEYVKDLLGKEIEAKQKLVASRGDWRHPKPKVICDRTSK